MRVPIPYRCDQVTQALALPGDPGTPGLDREAVAEHLAGCPDCAAWAARDTALTRAWELTRPVEPSTADWESLRARVRAGVEAGRRAEVPSGPRVIPFESWTGGRTFVRLFVAAQAAAILGVAFLGSARRPEGDGPLPGRPDTGGLVARAVAFRYDIDTGPITVIRGDETGVRAVQVAVDDSANTLDANFTMLNDVESMAD